MTKSMHLNFENNFLITMMSLRANGAHPYIARNKMWLFHFAILFSISMTVLYFLCYSVLYHDLKYGNFALVCKGCTIIIVCMTVQLKYLSLVAYQKSIQNLIESINNDYIEVNNSSDEDKGTVLEYVKKGSNVCTFWLFASFSVSLIFPLKAIFTMIHYYRLGDFKLVSMFELTFPEPIETNKNVPIVFCLLFLLSMSFGLYASSMFLGFDPIIPIFMLHVCGQLKILSRRLGKLFAEVEDAREIERQLKIMIIKLQNLYTFMDSVKRNFSLIYEYIMKSSIFLLPLTAFQIIVDLRNNSINFEFISFMNASLLHFFVPAYYSDVLMDTSNDFRGSIYSSGWEKCPDKRVRQIILFMITRARIPMGIRTVFHEINLDTFAQMCRQSYTILNLMNAAWT